MVIGTTKSRIRKPTMAQFVLVLVYQGLSLALGYTIIDTKGVSHTELRTVYQTHVALGDSEGSKGIGSILTEKKGIRQ